MTAKTYTASEVMSALCVWEAMLDKAAMENNNPAYLIETGLVIVSTYRGGGWDAYTALPKNDIEATIADVIERCKAKETA
jgi:hypothetical protein